MGTYRWKAESPVSVTELTTRSSRPLLVMAMDEDTDTPTNSASKARGLGLMGTRICGFCGNSSGHPAPSPPNTTAAAATDHLARTLMSVILAWPRCLRRLVKSHPPRGGGGPASGVPPSVPPSGVPASAGVPASFTPGQE